MNYVAHYSVADNKSISVKSSGVFVTIKLIDENPSDYIELTERLHITTSHKESYACYLSIFHIINKLVATKYESEILPLIKKIEATVNDKYKEDAFNFIDTMVRKFHNDGMIVSVSSAVGILRLLIDQKYDLCELLIASMSEELKSCGLVSTHQLNNEYVVKYIASQINS